jgi:hypothetical protein
METIASSTVAMLEGSMRMLSEVEALRTRLKKALERARQAQHTIANPFGGPDHPRDYTQDPYIPPWAIGSGLGGLLTPYEPPPDPFAPNPNDPDPTNIYGGG